MCATVPIAKKTAPPQIEDAPRLHAAAAGGKLSRGFWRSAAVAWRAVGPLTLGWCGARYRARGACCATVAGISSCVHSIARVVPGDDALQSGGGSVGFLESKFCARAHHDPLSVAQLAEHQTVELSHRYLRVTGSIPVAEKLAAINRTFPRHGLEIISFLPGHAFRRHGPRGLLFGQGTGRQLAGRVAPACRAGLLLSCELIRSLIASKTRPVSIH